MTNQQYDSTENISPRKLKRESSKKRNLEILEATRVLLSEKGYDKLSLRKIAVITGIHLKTLQHYFPTKEILIKSTLEYVISLYDKKVQEISTHSSDPEKNFKNYIKYLIEDTKNIQTAGFFYQLWAMSHVDEKTNNIMNKMYLDHTNNIENLIETLNPDMGNHMRKHRAVMIAALIEGMMLFVGYGKKRPKNTAHIEKEIVALCTNLAVSNDSL
jgi:AcrR family transcriptional regulator